MHNKHQAVIKGNSPPASRPSVLMVLYYYYPYVSGLSEVARILAENLVRDGYSVTVLTTLYDPTLPKHERLKGVEVLRVPLIMRFGKGVVAPRLTIQAIRLAREFDYVCFHLPLAESGVAAQLIDPSKFTPFYHCDLNLGASFVSRLIERFAYVSMGVALARAKKIIVSSHDYFSHSKFSHYGSKAVAINLPIDDHRFFRKDPASLRKKLDLPVGKFLIGFVGRIVREKGLPYLLTAIGYLEGHIPNFIVVVAGDYEHIAGGSIKSELDHFLLKFPGRILFTGFLPEQDLVAFYNMIDVLVLPSVDPLEAFGMVQVEAMLCGTPVVASNLPGVREVIRTVGFGCLATPGDPKDIACQIIKIIKDPPILDPEKLKPFMLEQTLSRFKALWP